MKIILVCTGNTCRSPMAEALLKRELARHGGHEVSSAGLFAASGEPASSNAITVMGEFGIDIGSHRASMLDNERSAQADLILTMTAGHKDAIIKRNPQLKEKVFTLAEFISEEADLADPYGGDITIYRSTAKELHRMVKKAAERLADSPHQPER